MLRLQAVLAALVVAAALPGCATPPEAQPAPAAAPEPQPPAAEPAFDLLACEGTDSFFLFDDASVEAQMPPGYRAYTVQGHAGALVAVVAVVCDVAVGGVLAADVPLVRSFVQVGPSSFYLFEWAFPTERAPALADWLSSRGWPVQDADVSILPGAVTVRGAAVDYVVLNDAQAAGGVPLGSASGGTIHLLHGEGPVRLDENNTMDVPDALVTAPTLVAAQGALARFAPAALASASAGLQFARLTMESRFTVPPEEQPIEPIRT